MSAEIVATLRSLLSGDNAVRSAAERQYNAVKQAQPALLVSGLFQAIAEPQLELPVREQACVLLRQCLSGATEATSVWAHLGDESVRCQVRAKLLECMRTEPQDKVRRKVADCVQHLANQLIDIPEGERPTNVQAWPEFLPELLGVVCDATVAPGPKADALWALKETAISVWPVLVANGDQTARVLQACLGDAQDHGIRSAACVLLCELVSNLEHKADRQLFTALSPSLLSATEQLAEAGSTHLSSVLQAFQAGGFLLWFLKDRIATNLLPCFHKIATCHGDTDARKLALEALLTMVESSPKTMLKMPRCIELILEASLRFTQELDSDLDGWAAQDEESAEDEDSHILGRTSIARFSESAQQADSFPRVMEVLQPALVSLLEQNDWKGIVVGLSVLAQIIEYVDDPDLVGKMVTVVRGQLRSSNARVRHTAWRAIMQFATDQSEVVASDALCGALLPDFRAGFSDPCERVVLACMSAFPQFGEHIERENMEQFVQSWMEVLGQKLQGSPAVQRGAITCIAVIAAQTEDGFAQYYTALMPILKQMVANTIHKAEERVLLGKAFECISLLANVVGRAAFRPDAEAIMQAMIQTAQIPNLTKDDPVQEYIMAAAGRFCATLKEDFLPFVPHILPIVLEKLKAAPTELQGEVPEDAGSMQLSVSKGDDGKMKVLVMKTSDIEDLQNAMQCVCTFGTELGPKFGPFLAPAAQALLPVFDLLVSEEIRDSCFATWGQLCVCAREGNHREVLQELCGEFLRRVVPKLQQADRVEALHTRAAGLQVCLAKAGPGILTAEQVRVLGQLALTLLGASLERRDAAKAKHKNEAEADLDETQLTVEDVENNEEALQQGLAQLAIALMQHHPDSFATECLPLYLPVVERFIQPTAGTSDRQLALLLSSGCCQWLGERFVPHWSGVMTQVTRDMHDQDVDIRGTACFVISMAAKLQSFGPLAGEAVSRAKEVLVQTRSLPKKKSEKRAQGAADNALSALLESLLHQQAALGDAKLQADLWAVWLSGMPCQEDTEEGVRNTRALAQLMHRQAVELLGQSGQNVPRVLSLLIDAHGGEMCDEETTAAIGPLLLGVGEANLTKYAGAFSEKQQKKLRRIVLEAQRAGAGAA